MSIKSRPLLAKHEGGQVSFESHSINVGKFAEMITMSLLDIRPMSSYESLPRLAYLGGLFHDLGKITDAFQTYLYDNKIIDAEDFKFRHNEISWAFIMSYIDIGNDNQLELLADAAYWHHAFSYSDKREMTIDRANEILKQVTQDEIQEMISMVKFLAKNYPEVKVLEAPRPNLDIRTPIYFQNIRDTNNLTNPIKFILRTAILCADRSVSSVNVGEKIFSTDEIKSMIEMQVNRSNCQSLDIDAIDSPSTNNNQRFIEQKEIAKTFVIGGTNQANGPGGYGKTRLALLHALQQKEKIIFVCPRNGIAHNIYRTVLEDLKDMGLSNLTVELFLSGQVKKRNNDSSLHFQSDIIVTNIDNFGQPTIDDGKSENLFLINKAIVIFDEYHEYMGNSGLMALFILLMTIRNRMTKSSTLIMSATPTNINEYWDSLEKPTHMFPKSNGKIANHFPSPYNAKFKFIIKDSFDITKIDLSMGNELIISNSIVATQTLLFLNSTASLHHSKFLEDAKIEKYNVLIATYGKNNTQEGYKPSVIGTNILEASLDIALNKLYEFAISPQATGQRIARINRFGKNKEVCEVVIFQNYENDSLNQSENAMKHVLYNPSLSKKWYEEMRKLNGKIISLDEFYAIYNTFQFDHRVEIKKYLDDCYYKNSLEQLTLLYPQKSFSKKENDSAAEIKLHKRYNADKKSFRQTKSRKDLFCIYPIYNEPNAYSEAFVESLYGEQLISEKFKERGQNIFNKIKHTYMSLEATDDKRFNFKKIIRLIKRGVSLDKLQKEARMSDTPYPRYDELYSHKYGVISEERHSFFINNEKVN